ncbi:MAG: VCBS repeat-containing protein [Flavobacteriales bacterium]|nr:VCBS repeat-containing protein [Flavobacteriales bacterium]
MTFPFFDFGTTLTGDLNGDSIEDLLLIGAENGSPAYIYPGGTAYPSAVIPDTLLATEGRQVVSTDFDADGLNEIVLINHGIPWSSQDRFDLYWNNGNFDFELDTLNGIFEPDEYDPPNEVHSIALGDFNGDGLQDLVNVGGFTESNAESGLNKLFINNGNRTFIQKYPSGDTPITEGQDSFGDLDGDGDFDLLRAGSDVEGNAKTVVYRNKGGLIFENWDDTTFIGVKEAATALFDFTNDGLIDVMISGRDTFGDRKTHVYINNGNGNFSEVMNHGIIDFGVPQFRAMNLNGDSLIDLLVIKNSVLDPTIEGYINQGGVCLTGTVNLTCIPVSMVG